jgi:hypothetical protein
MTLFFLLNRPRPPFLLNRLRPPFLLNRLRPPFLLNRLRPPFLRRVVRNLTRRVLAAFIYIYINIDINIDKCLRYLSFVIRFHLLLLYRFLRLFLPRLFLPRLFLILFVLRDLSVRFLPRLFTLFFIPPVRSGHFFLKPQ